ncbi:hypothetical protein ACEYW6_06370 [Nostoc sp. UIC 10607]|uniref:hypothetical protein n=1 Tax=Nostoc sp. UIC 10607 TaxID=3045935 RepID=UPI0039A18845
MRVTLTPHASRKSCGNTAGIEPTLIVLETIALPLSKYVSFFCQGTSDIRDLYR